MYILVKGFPSGIVCVRPSLVENLTVLVRLYAENNSKVYFQYSGEQTANILEDTGELTMTTLPEKGKVCEVSINSGDPGLKTSPLFRDSEAQKLYKALGVFLNGLGIYSFSMKFKKNKNNK